jgi:hypothetical protein
VNAPPGLTIGLSFRQAVSHLGPSIRPTDGPVCQAAASDIDIDSFFMSSR